MRNERKIFLEKPLIDSNGILFKDGDIFDIHQTVNGCNTFILINNNVFYFYSDKIQQEYEYDVIDLLDINKEEKEVEIIGNIFIRNIKSLLEN